MIDTIPKWGKEFTISFILLLQPSGIKGWSNILHLTATGQNYGLYPGHGSRIPLVGLRDDKMLHITMDNDVQLTYDDMTLVKHDKFLAIQIQQRLENNKVCTGLSQNVSFVQGVLKNGAVFILQISP